MKPETVAALARAVKARMKKPRAKRTDDGDGDDDEEDDDPFGIYYEPISWGALKALYRGDRDGQTGSTVTVNSHTRAWPKRSGRK